MVKVNLGGVAVGREPLPAGKYLGKFVSFKNGKTKNGDFMFTCKCTVASDADGETEHAGRELYVNQTIMLPDPKNDKEGNLHFLKATLVSLGADASDLDTDIDTDAILRELIGNDVGLAVSIGEYGGRPSNNVNIVSADAWG